ncbi:MAG: hypothetical protein BHV70_02600 [Bacteroidales bacterium 55_9]|nr:MAG: hypothetical protein BHV70_02600 [Bacteroidales bacterium 55_9]
MMSEFLTYSLRTGACIAVFYLFFKLLLSRETFHAFNRALVLAATAVSFVLPLCVITVQRTLPARETVSTSDEYPYPAYADIVTPAADTPTDAPAGGSLSAARVMAASATPLPEETVAPESEETVMPEPEGMVSPLTEEDILSDHASAESVAAVQPSVSEAVETSHGVEIPWRQIGIVIYLAGVAAVIFVTVRSIVGLHRLMRRGRCERLDDGTTLVRMDENVAPISWCRNIVISERDLRENGAAILAHERAHVRLHHSLDLLLVDLAGAVQWFNPAMWLLRRDLRAIHEYEADAAVIASGVDARSYQLLLIRKAVGGRWYSIANSFNHSKLKNRITMMLREKSSRRTRARALLLLPLAGLALGAFAKTVYVRPEDKVTKEFSENQLSEMQIVSDMESAAGSRIGMPRGGGDDATVVAGDTIRRGEMPKTRDWDSLSEQERERIRKYFESDEWKAKAEELEKMGEYFESDEWKRKMQEIEDSGKKLEEYFNSDEWKANVKKLENMGEYFESDEWKQKMQEIEESSKKLEEYFNSDEWKEFRKNNMTSDTIRLKDGTLIINNNIVSDGRPTLGAIRTEDGRVIISDNWGDSLSPEERERLKEFFESDEWQKAQAKLKKMGDYFSSDDWIENSKELEKIGEYFNSDEWREAWKHAGQAASSGDDAYFQSDEWKAIKEKLDAWRAVRAGKQTAYIQKQRQDVERWRQDRMEAIDSWQQGRMDAIESMRENRMQAAESMQQKRLQEADGKQYTREELADAKSGIHQAAYEAKKQALDEAYKAKKDAQQTAFEARRDAQQQAARMRQSIQTNIADAQRQIAAAQEDIQQSGDNDRRIKREMRKTQREMDRTNKEMSRAREEIEQAREEIEQARLAEQPYAGI